jgi:acyl-CoA synthetase (AMP-forming)/AMP-acid ligase II
MSHDSGIGSIADIPRIWGSLTPDKVALVEARRAVTYGELDERSNRIANAIIAAGVRPGSHIGYLGKNSVAFYEIWMGVTKAGCALCPLNWRGPAVELAGLVHDAKLPMIFVGPGFAGLAVDVRRLVAVLLDLVKEEKLVDWLADADCADPGVPVAGHRTALLAYTSGTTGTPKGVQITHAAFANWFRFAASEPAPQWSADDVGLMTMPNFHLAGTWVTLPALNHGATLAILPAFDPDDFVQAVGTYRPTVACLVPTAIQLLLDHRSSRSCDFSSLRRLLYAGSPIGIETLRRAIAVFGCDLVQFYGTTETYIITLLRPEQHRPDDPRLLTSCGKPMPMVELRVVSPDGRDVATGVVGEVLVRSPWMFTSYWNKPHATAAAIVDGWYHTGDVGTLDENGNLYLVDRLKDMIVSGGENVYSAEVERALAGHPGVAEVAVVGAPDEKWGERVVAFVVQRPVASVTAADLVAHCRRQIAGYKVPKAIHFVPALPSTASGKVRKAVLRQRLLEAAGVTG